MAESFISSTKELEVLKRNASKIHRAISDHRLLSMDLLSANLISLPTLQKVNVPVATPYAQSYELINNLLQAVVCDPNNFRKLLGVLENHPPLLTAVAKEMKEDYESCEIRSMVRCTSPAKQSESTNDQQKEIIIADGRSMQRSYDRMLGKLAGLVFDFQKIVEKANIGIEDLKQYVILYHPEKEYKDELRKARDINEVFDVIRSKFCSLFNYAVLLRIAEKFNLAEGFKVIEDYEAEEENYRRLLSSSTLASELQRENELLRQNSAHAKTIVLKLQKWPRPPAPTVVEFLEIIKDVFSDLGDLIHLLKVEPGSIIATMIAPERVMGALIALAKRKIAYLKDIGVTWLAIGGTIIINETEEPSHDVPEHEELSSFSPKLESNSDDSNQNSTAVGEDVGDAPPPIPVRVMRTKDHYTSKLIQEGLSHQEISEKVKDKTSNESESTLYETLYGALELLGGYEEDDFSEEDDANYEPPTVKKNIHDPEPPPPVPPRDLSLHERENTIYESYSYVRLVKWQDENKEKDHTHKPSPEIQSIQPHPPPFPPPFPPLLSLPPPSPPLPPSPRRHSISQTTPLTKTLALRDRLHNRQETWYIECDRSHAEMHLRGKQNGTFLCRPSGKAVPIAKGGEIHTHTIDIVYNGGIKHLKVVQDSKFKYGFSVPCSYNSLLDLVLHFSKNSLVTHNPNLTTTLAFPVFS